MCLVSMPNSTEVNINLQELTSKNFAVYRPRKDIPFKTKIDKSIP